MQRYLFVNENIGGHRTVHDNLRRVFADLDGVRVDFLDVPQPASGLRRLVGAGLPGLAKWDADLQPLRFQLAISQWVKTHLRPIVDNYDAVHFYTQNTALRSVPLLRTLPFAVASDSTNLLNATRIPHRDPSRCTTRAARLSRRFELPVYSNAGLLLASSSYVAESLINDYQQSPQKIRVVPMGISIPELPEPSRSTRPRLVFVGTPLRRKGGEQLLRWAATRWRGVCELTLVTKTPVTNAPANVKVVNDLTPGDPRLWEVLTGSDIFVFPSQIDQAPNAVLEAMAAWLPVVAMNVAAIPEMVVNEQTGLLTPPGDMEAFAGAVDRLIADEHLRREMARGGHRHVCTHYDIRQSAHRTLEELQALAKAKP